MDEKVKEMFEIVADFMEATNRKIEALENQVFRLQERVNNLEKLDDVNNQIFAEMTECIRQIDDRK